MTRLNNDPKKFPDEALTGFVAANLEYVQAVHGGVVRSTASPQGEVAVVLGGGSGHYPAFAGWVGPGLAHGAACGNIFSSPSASQVYAVAQAADNGGGVIFGFGNYAGDVLHFGQAAERLRAEGVDVRVVTASDDIASNSPEKALDRRGIAGDLPVFKVMGAAAARGLGLDEVERLSRHANDRTRTLGVAFSGCTLPGADHPLFTVPDGQMGIGLGIHGEPGIETRPRGSAADVADLLVDAVMAEEPARTSGGYQGRVALLLNGLGTTKYEELFVVYGRVVERLTDAGLAIVRPEVGEHVTSLDMAGLSLTLMFLDDELEPLWLHPADTPALRRGTVESVLGPRHVRAADGRDEIEAGSPESQQLAASVLEGLEQVARLLSREEERLGDMDAVAGDGDHGQGMVLGISAAVANVREVVGAGAGARTVFVRAGDAWSEGAGGTSGALWGACLTAIGGALDDQTGASEQDLARAATSGAEAIQRLGGAKVGDKTMVDALAPFIDTLNDALPEVPLAQAWAKAAAVAEERAEKTADITALKGRARTHGDKSVGTPDPGAVSLALIVKTIGAVFGGE